MNSTNMKASNSSECAEYISTILYKMTSSIGFISNLICIIVFSYLIKTNKSSQQFVYGKFLLSKSFFDFVVLFLIITNRYLNCEECYFSFKFQINLLTFRIYLSFICALCSVLCDIFSSLDRYVLISKNLKIYKKISFNAILIFVVLFSSIFYSFKFFEIEVNQVTISNLTQYKLEESVDTKFIYFRFVHSLVRDLICVLIQFALNILIFIKFKKIIKSKEKFNSFRLVSKNSKILRGRKSTKKKKYAMAKIENNKTKMIIIMNFLSIIRHFPMFISYLPIIEKLPKHFCITLVVENVYLFLISSNIFLYLYFDYNFKNSFKALFKKFKFYTISKPILNSTTISSIFKA